MSNAVLENLIEELKRLPGVGPKTAERLAYHLLKVSAPEALALASAIRRLKEELRQCERCFNITEEEQCEICRDSGRDATVVCVVEQPKDLQVIEASGSYRGLYHVLGGSFSPLENRGPESLTVAALRDRIVAEGIREVILATNPDLEGDGTALLVTELLEDLDVDVSRIARGVPTGSQLEYMNQSIIRDAMTDRRSVRRPDGDRS